MQQQSELPQGWVSANVSDICQLINGRAFKPSDWSDKGLPIIRIQNLNNVKAKFNYCDFEVDSKYYLNSGQLLFAWSGTPGTSFGAHIWERGKAVLNQHIFRVEIDVNTINKLFLKHSLNYNIAGYIEKAHGTAGLAHITKKKFETSVLSFPPLAEQHRIVSAIEALFARLDAANERLDRVPEILNTFRQSVLAAACDGRLTEGWREENPDVEIANELIWSIIHEKEIKLGKREKNHKNTSNKNIFQGIPKSWSEASLDEISIKITDGTHHSPPNGPKGDFKYITAKNIKNDGINLKKLTFISAELHDEIYSRCNPEYGDLLLIKDGATTGIATLNNLAEPFSMLSSVALLKFPEKISNKYIMYCIRSPIFQSNILDKMGGAAITRLTLKKISNMVIPLPPLPEQHEIVRRVDALFDLADSIEANVTAAKKRTEKMRQSILTKAFSRELVETEAELARREGRDYEPADVLLERIEVERGEG